VVGISHVDTRAITRHLRERGAMRVGVFSGAGLCNDDGTVRPLPELVAQVRATAQMAGADLCGEVSTEQAYVVPAIGTRRFTVAAIDLGIKAMTPHRMAQRGIEVQVLPVTATLTDILATGADGVFFSNGPGDPGVAAQPVALLGQVLAERLPFFGICFGHQLFGRALGLGTYKLGYGHRGMNQPVQDRATGRVEVTAHNHGFAVDAPADRVFDTPFGPAEVSHLGLNDGVVEGLRCLDRPAFSVQYHPEAAAGPHDAGYLFDRFADLMTDPSAAPRRAR
jgi:carbamoyl-phosphate synthase small subunit